VNLELGELAGKIRASTGLRLPDAIIVATGIITEADWVITEDTHFKQASSYISPIMPDEYTSPSFSEP
jgi:predicted nucleic acid-binding protein